MADTRLSDLSAAGALSASDLFYVVQTPGSGGEKATGTQLLTLVGTTYVPLAGGTMTGALTIASGTLTASAPALNITQTANNGAVIFKALTMDVTNTASARVDLLDLKINGSSILTLDHNANMSGGNFIASNGRCVIGGSYDVRVGSTSQVGWTSGAYSATMDAAIYRDAAGILGQRIAGTAQAFRIYGTYTDSSNYERLSLSTTAGTSVNITAETLGTGGDNLDIVLTPAGTGNNILSAGHLFVKVNNARIEVSSAGAYQFSAGTAGQTGADIAFRRSAIGVVDVDSGTANAYRDLKLRNLLAGGGNGSYVQTPSMTVTNLAAAGTAGAGARAFVTDATATTFLSTVAGGGANKVPVVSDGTNWLIG